MKEGMTVLDGTIRALLSEVHTSRSTKETQNKLFLGCSRGIPFGKLGTWHRHRSMSIIVMQPRDLLK